MDYEVTIKGFNFKFINEVWSTRNAWGHKTQLLQDGVSIALNKVRYLNRTWEFYQFQSSMSGAIYMVKEDLVKNLISEYKEKTGKRRLSKELKEEILNQNEMYQVYTELNNIVQRRNFYEANQ